MSSLKEQFNKGLSYYFLLIGVGSVPDLKKVNPEDVASVFKMFFAELPEPLFPLSVYKDVASSLGNCTDTLIAQRQKHLEKKKKN